MIIQHIPSWFCYLLMKQNNSNKTSEQIQLISVGFVHFFFVSLIVSNQLEIEFISLTVVLRFK